MFGVVILALVVVVILVTVLFIIRSLIGKSSDDRETESHATRRSHEREAFEIIEPIHAVGNSKVEPGNHESLVRSVRFSNDNRHETERFQRPPTPVHYRPPTPIHSVIPRSVTPVNEQLPKPHTAVNHEPPSYRHLQTELDNVVSEHDTRFVKYHELSAQEKGDILDLSQYIIDVDHLKLDSMLAMIKAIGDGRPLEYVIARSEKKHDKQLSPSEKQLRKSFKIKHRQSNLCRFARLKVTHIGPSHYRLLFADYTPYIEEHAPKFDPFRQEIAKERSHWETVDVSLHHNSASTNIRQMQILIPGKNQ